MPGLDTAVINVKKGNSSDVNTPLIQPETALSLAEVSRIRAYFALASLAFGSFALGTNEL